MLHECSTCTFNAAVLMGGGGGEFQTPWLHNSAWFRTLGVGIIIIFNKQLCSN